MSKGEKESRVPKLRFKGFADDWMHRPINAIATVHSGRDYKHLKEGNIPVYGTGGYMTSVNESLSNIDSVGIGRKGTINKPQLLSAPFWTVDTLFFITVKDELDLLFFYYLTQNINWLRYDESTGVPSLSKKTIESIKVKVPRIKEQNWIGKLLIKLDKIITLEQEKLFHYKKLREDLLQKFFPGKDKVIPEWRFEGFNDKWKVERLENIGIIQTGNTPRTSNQEYYDENGLLWVTPTDIKNMNIKDTKRKISKEGCKVARIVPKGSILITSIASIGKNALTTEKVAFNQQINALIPNNENNSYFLFIQSKFWSEHMKRIASTGTMQIINKSEFSQILTTVPTRREQEKIGKLFKQIDEIVDKKQTKLEKYTCTKNILLKYLFV